ncbi:MAG: polyhydroxybutyrate depolymerase [Frankiales bacterium]|nr:polyhydroxybutyrate depolymerase [Frankiales bacterium]
MRGSTSVLSGLLAAGVVSALVLLASPASTAAPALRAVSSTAGAGTTESVDLVQQDTPSGPVSRHYLFTVPRSGSGPRPVVLVLHGRSQPIEDLRATTGIEAVGEQAGFVSVFPSGVQGVWNAGTCCAPANGSPAMPDVAFLDQVVADLATRTSVDLRRVHVVGFSNGGMMAYRYACQRSDRVAGVAVVSGSMAASPDYADQGPQRCRPTSPVSVLAVHGGSDTTVPYGGGTVAGPGGGTVAPARAGIDQSAVGASCRTGSTSKVGATVRLDYTDCEDGAAVRLVKINGQGHGWTRDSRRYGYDTTLGIWQFLQDRRSAPDDSP